MNRGSICRVMASHPRKFIVQPTDDELKDYPTAIKYLIKKGRAGNVVSIKDGKPVEKYCIHPDDPEMPDEDCMLAQLLLLTHDEQEFLRIANRTRLAA